MFMSKKIITINAVLLVGVFGTSLSASYGGADDGSSDFYRGHGTNGNNNKQLPVILMHKQALQQDGGFQYAFAADNGHRQDETISPDGSRTGAYSYTDPEGKEITVKYTAGKDGFRILQGDHVPKAPLTVAEQSPATGGGGGSYSAVPSFGRSSNSAKNRLFGAPGGPGSQFSRGNHHASGGRFDHNSGESSSSYKLPKFAKQAQPVHYRVREDDSAEFPSRYEDDGSSAYDGDGDYSSHRPFRAPIAVNEAEKDDEFRSDQPHNFGSGYAFEFAGDGAAAVAGTSAEF